VQFFDFEGFAQDDWEGAFSRLDDSDDDPSIYVEVLTEATKEDVHSASKSAWKKRGQP